MSAGDLSYAGLGGLVRRFSSMLRSLGIYKGAHVFTVMGRGPELYVAMLGALRNGSVVSPRFSAYASLRTLADVVGYVEKNESSLGI
jgi:acetyl-CoA synthetase